MATRGTISIQNLDGTVHTCYCHWDNYISNNGVILNKYYNSRELVEKLISGAAISSLGRYLSDKPMDFSNHDRDFTNYYSNRGEYTEIRHFKDFDDYEENATFEDYNYIFTKDNVWSVEYNGEWHDLEFEIIENGYTDPYEGE